MSATPASAVLFSGGLDSAVLLALELTPRGPVQPIHVRAGFVWEASEARAIARVLAAPPFAEGTLPLRSIAVDLREVYPSTHWAMTGHPPSYDSPDKEVYLEGRNAVLISTAAVLCARLGVGRLALGALKGNPFPDATPEFFDTMARALSLGLAHPLVIAAPLAERHKADVIRLGHERHVPFGQTMSCMNPMADDHCGRCSKCRERREAFHAAGIDDPTTYV